MWEHTRTTRMFWKAVRGADAALLTGLPASIASWMGLVTPLACTFLREASAVATSPSCRSRGTLSAYRHNQFPIMRFSPLTY
jgi:hypothetical protein